MFSDYFLNSVSNAREVKSYGFLFGQCEVLSEISRARSLLASISYSGRHEYLAFNTKISRNACSDCNRICATTTRHGVSAFRLKR